MNYYIGMDLGTSASKFLLMDSSGNILINNPTFC